MLSRRMALSLLIGSAGSIACLWFTDLPLGVPGEWVWQRVPLDRAPLADVLLSGLLALVAAGLYVGFGWLGATRISNARTAEIACWLTGLTVLAFGWLWIVQETPADVAYRLPKAALVLYYRGPSGYFDEARYRMDDVSSFLAEYEGRMSEGDVLHVGTHPPGLFVWHRALIELCGSRPGLSRLLLFTQPDSVRAMFSEIGGNARRVGRSLDEADRAALWLAALMTQLVAALTVVPLYLLLRRTRSPRTSWQTVLLWPLVPALAVFLPKSDALFPFLGMGFLYAWLEGWRRGSVPGCVAAGLIFWLGMSLSLAVLPVAVFAAAITVWEAYLCDESDRVHGTTRRLLVSLAWTLSGFCVMTIAVWAAFDLNLVRVWLWNYTNHQGFYDVYARTYWKWLLVNPLELALSLGLPVVVLAVAGFWRSLGKNWAARQNGPYWCCLAVWGLLWLSGKNSGETARLWLVVMPWLVWLASGGFPHADQAISAAPRSRWHTFLQQDDWLLVLSLQALVCLFTVARVTGFHFT